MVAGRVVEGERLELMGLALSNPDEEAVAAAVLELGHPDLAYVVAQGEKVFVGCALCYGLPEEARERAVEPARYAEFRWRGSFFSPEFARFYGDALAWIEAHGLSPDPEAPHIELYDRRTHRPHDRAWTGNELTLRIPLR